MRVNNSLKNISVALICQIIGILVSFVSRMVFIDILGTEYLGISGLFTNILSMLSLAEMGFGTAIIYSLYKPLAIKDSIQVKALMNFYKNIYRVIALIVLMLGLSIMPFLNYIIQDKPNIDYLNYIYLLFLINSVCTYFIAYKRTLITADQKNYIVLIYRYGFYIILNIIQIIILILTSNYILFLIAQIVMTILENIIVSIKANNMYSFLKNGEKIKLNDTTKHEIIKNVKAMICHKIGAMLVNGTDNIIISSFIGVIWVGMYSNYCMITNALYTIITQIFSSITASIGNLNVLESNEKSYQIYKKILFTNFWIAGFCTICLKILINPFISLWIGKQYLLEESIVIIISINFYISIIRKSTLTYKDSLGLFYQDRYKSLFEGLFNIIISIILAKNMGLLGVFIGTFLSSMLTVFWIEPYVLYKYGFKKSSKEYFIYFMKNVIILIPTYFVTNKLSSIFLTDTWLNLIWKLIICIIIPNVIFIGLFYKTNEFRYIYSIYKGILNKGKLGKLVIIKNSN